MFFALGRGAGPQGGIAKVSKTGAPTTALLVGGSLALLCVVILRLTGAGVLDATY